MRTWLRAIRLNVSTDEGQFGRTVSLAKGLNVLRGANSRGKTQLVQAVIYALGMERMLTARANAPLGSVFTTEIAVELAGGTERTYPTTSSWVAIELENSEGRIMTAQRFIKHPIIGRDLVRVWEDAALTGGFNSSGAQDLFLHNSGSATRSLGFHTRLQQFLGWSLPEVASVSGKPVLLYPDAVFPFLIVDQQSWGSAAPRKVERYQIKEPTKQGMQFLLALEGPAAQAERNRLELRVSELRGEWTSQRSAVRAICSTVAGRVAGVPENPAGFSDRAVSQPTDLASAKLEILQGEEWIDSDAVATGLNAELTELLQAQPPATAELRDHELTTELTEVRGELSEVLAATHLIESDVSLGEAQVAALDRRVTALSEERDRNADIRTLTRLGSEVDAEHLADHNCPTCRQSLDAVETQLLGPALDLEGTIQLLNAQTTTARRMRERASSALEQSSSGFAALQRHGDQLRTRIRALEADISGPQSQVSQGEVAHRVTLEIRRDELERVRSDFSSRLETMQEVANTLATTRQQLKGLPEGSPASDIEVLDAVTRLMRGHLRESGFGSYDVNELKLDASALRPTREGYDVDTDASASDVVRTKIAFLEAVRTVGAKGGNHPGLLILDEPRQQDIEGSDFGAILQYLARNAASTEGQVIVTSATAAVELERLLGPQFGSVQVLDFSSHRVLERLEVPDPLGV